MLKKRFEGSWWSEPEIFKSMMDAFEKEVSSLSQTIDG
jgi:hypothetical protein